MKIIFFDYHDYCLSYLLLTSKIRAFLFLNNISYNYIKGDKKTFVSLKKEWELSNYKIMFINGCIGRKVNELYFKNTISDFLSMNNKSKVFLFGCGGGISLGKLILFKERIIQVPIGKESIVDGLFNNLEFEFNSIDSLSSNNFLKVGSWRFLENKKRFYISVSRGCNNNCFYCKRKNVIGQPKSKKINIVINKIIKGYKKSKFEELVLVSDDLGSYGKDIGVNYITLLKEIKNLNLDFLINIDYIEPSSIISEIDNLIPLLSIISYICSPIQSFNDRILKLMNRKYQVNDYVRAIKKLRDNNKDLRITNHIIYGYPTESYSEFLNNIKYIELFNKTDFYLYSHNSKINYRLFGNNYIIGETELENKIKKLKELYNKNKDKVFYDKKNYNKI